MTAPRRHLRWQPKSFLALGGGPLGNLFEAVTDEVAVATIERAWERGIRSFDTAPHYGLGLSERRFGRALAGCPRDEYELSTKVGRLLVPADEEALSARDAIEAQQFSVVSDLRRQWDFSADGVRRSLDDSLARLAVDRIDVAYLHDPEHHIDQAADEAFPALARLRDEGVIRAVGVGTNSLHTARELIRRCPIDVLMIAGRLTLLDQSASLDVLPSCQEQGIAVMSAGVFNSGILAETKPTAASTFDYASATPEVLARVQEISQICARHGSSLQAAALVYAASRYQVDALCFGARSADEVDNDVDAIEAGLDAELWDELLRSVSPTTASVRHDRAI